ncbi:hypothetical protein ACNKHQ_08795 [Shigella flexneri]
MRVSLFPGLVQAVVYNQNRQQPRVRLLSGLAFRTRYSGTVGHSSGSDVSRCDLR